MKVALYARSSKDESAGLGVAAQEHELREWAAQRGDEVVTAYSDTELSGTLDESLRPGLDALLHAAKCRQFSAALVFDTSRIARDPELLLFVRTKMARHGAPLVFKSLPGDPATALNEFMLTTFAGVDRLHSRISAEKAVAAMKEATRQGWRMGGRAPYGYRRVVIPTGAVRNGSPVTRTKLEPDPAAAPFLRDFLKRRAAGEPRALAIEHSGVPLKPASLVSVERNAMLYAGFVVWNTRSFTKPNRDDRSVRTIYNAEDKVVMSSTPSHEALITVEEAHRIAALPKTRAVRVDLRQESLLGGLLVAPDGARYQMDERGQFYRAPPKGRRFSAASVDRAVMAAISRDAKSEAFIADAVNAARQAAAGMDTNAEAVRDRLARVQAKIDRIVDAVAEGVAGSAGSFGPKLRELEADKAHTVGELATAEDRAAMKLALQKWEPRTVSAWFDFAVATDVPTEVVRCGLRAVLNDVVLDPTSEDGAMTLNYRIAPEAGRRVASPRGFEPRSRP